MHMFLIHTYSKQLSLAAFAQRRAVMHGKGGARMNWAPESGH